MFESIYEVTQLRLNIRRFYEVSRILTKHCANYEAQKFAKMAADLESHLIEESDVMARYEAILNLQVAVMRNVMNFVSSALEKNKDTMEEEPLDEIRIKSKFKYTVTIPKGMAILGYVIELLKQYQSNYFYRDVELEEVNERLQNLKHDIVHFMEQDVAVLIQLFNIVMKKAIWYVDAAVMMQCKNN